MKNILNSSMKDYIPPRKEIRHYQVNCQDHEKIYTKNSSHDLIPKPRITLCQDLFVVSKCAFTKKNHREYFE